MRKFITFIRSRPENHVLQNTNEQWPLSINLNRLRPLGRSSRRLILAFALILGISDFVFAAEIETGSKITEVTVYPDSALISRLAKLKLTTGEHKIIFSHIIPDVDENSLRVSGQGQAEVKLFGAQVKKEFLEEAPAEKVKQLQDEIQSLDDEKRKAEDNKKILLEEKGFLDSIRLFSHGQLPKELVTKMPAVKDLEDMLKFLDTKLKDNYSQVIDVELRLRYLHKKIDALRRELGQIMGPAKKLKRSIVVDVEVLKPGDLDLTVSYLVRGASWQPIYDARAEFAKGEVEFVSYAIARQKTGEEWQDIQMYLSTAKPSVEGRLPYVAPWFIRPYQPPVERSLTRTKGLRLTEQYQSMALEGVRDMAEAEKMELEVQYASPQEKGIAVTYKILRKATIKPDGSEHKLPISAQTLKADFVYTTYPRASDFAYLGSRVKNSKDLQLLAGRVNVFLEGDFVGASSIDNIGPGEDFDLYLGVDESVKVKRQQIEKKVDDVLIAGIPAPNRRTTFKYKTTIENYKTKKIKVFFFEAMPVSENERIKVKVSNVSLEPKEKDWKDRKGVWRWELELEPKAKQEIFYTFSIEHPRDLQVEGL